MFKIINILPTTKKESFSYDSFVLGLLILFSLLSFNVFSQQVQKRPQVSLIASGSSIMNIAKPQGSLPGDVLFIQITQHSTFPGTNFGNGIQANGWQVVAQSDAVSSPLAQNAKWKTTVLYRIHQMADPELYSFILDPNTNYSTASLSAYFNVDTLGGYSVNGTGAGPFDVIPGAFNLQYSSIATLSNSVRSATPGAGMLMFATLCGNAEMNYAKLNGPFGYSLPMQVFDSTVLNSGYGISSCGAFAVEEEPAFHSTSSALFNATQTLPSLAVMIALKPRGNDQVNTQVIYPEPVVCNTSNDLMIPQIIGRVGGQFSASPLGLSMDTLTGAILPAASVAGQYSIRYYIAPEAGDPGVDVIVTVDLVAPPFFQIQYNQSRICAGDSLIMGTNAFASNPNTGLSFLWSGPNGFTGEMPNVIIPNFNTQHAGVYSVTVNNFDVPGCSTTLSTPQIFASPVPQSASISGDQSICSGSVAHLYVNVSGGNAPYSFTYNTGIGTRIDTVTNYDGYTAITQSLTSSTSFYLLGLTSQDGCPALYIDATPAHVAVNPVLTASFSATTATTVCRGTSVGVKVDISGAYAGSSFTVKYTDGVNEFVIDNYLSGTAINLAPVTTTTYQLTEVLLSQENLVCPVQYQNSLVSITVNQPVNMADLYVYTSNPMCGRTNGIAYLKIRMSGGKVPYTVQLTTNTGTALNPFTYDTTATLNSQRFLSVTPWQNTQYKINSIKDGNGCLAPVNVIGDTATVNVVPTAVSSTCIFTLSGYQNICGGTNTRVFFRIYGYNNTTNGFLDRTNRYTVIYSIRVNNQIVRYDTLRNYVSNTILQIPTNIQWSGSMEIALVKVTNSLNCSLTSFRSTAQFPSSSFFTLRQAAIPGNISGSTRICSGDNSASITLDSYTGTIQWYKSTLFNGTFTPINGSTSDTLSVQNLTSTAYYKALVTNGTCTNYSSVATVAVDSMPVAGMISGDDTTCMGEDVSLQLNNTSGTVNWMISEDGLQFSSLPYDTTDILLIPAIQTGAYFQAVVNRGVCPSSSTPIHQIVVKDPGLWVGTSNADNGWNNPNNWACGRVPDNNTDVSILAQGNSSFPLIGSVNTGFSDTGFVHNLYVESGASMLINEGGLLRISGNILGDGDIDSRLGNIEMIGTADTQHISPARFSDKTVKTLKISNPGGVLAIDGTSDTLRVADKVVFGVSNATLDTRDRLVLVSNANGTASIADMTSDGVNSGVYSGNRIIGKVTVERFIPQHYKAWQFLAAPAVGQSIRDAWQEGNGSLVNNHPGFGVIITSNVPNAVAQGFDMSTPGATLKTYQAETNSWVSVPSTLQNIDNTKGYMLFVRGDRSVTSPSQSATATTLRITGNLYTPVDNPPVSVNVQADRFEAIGNPYASAIDFSKINKTGGIQDVFYVWDPMLTNGVNGSYGFGAYQTFVGVGNGMYRVIPGGGSYGNTDLLQPGTIQSGQAFFARTSGMAGTLNFSESNKVAGSSLVTRMSATDVPAITVRLSVKNAAGNATLLDGVLAEFDETHSSSVGAEDVVKMTNSSENISIINAENNLVVDRRTLVSVEDTIKLSLGQLRIRNYRLEIAAEQLGLTGKQAQVYDAYTGTFTALNPIETTNVDFSVSTDAASASARRFIILISGDRNALPVRISQVKAQRRGDDVMVSWKTEQESDMNKYVVERSEDGKNFTAVKDQVAFNTSGIKTYSIHDVQPGYGMLYYRVKALENNGQIVFTEIVKVSAIEKNFTLEVNPNPVTKNTIHLFAKGLKTGAYPVSLFDMNGKKMMSAQIEYQEGRVVKISCPSGIPFGKYQLVLYPAGQKPMSISVFIQE